MPTTKLYLGKLLLDHQLVTQEQLDKAVARQQITGERLGRTLIDLGFIKEDVLLTALSKQLNIPYVDLRKYSLDLETVQLLPEINARRFRALVLKNEGENFLVGMVDPLDVLAVDELKLLLKSSINIALIREEDFLKIIDTIYRRTSEIVSLAEELSDELTHNDFDIAQLAAGLSTEDAPVAKLLNSIFVDAVQVNASDIHIEPDEHAFRIRLRIDGVLHEHVIKEHHIVQALTLRLKLMAGLNIAEKRLPQDGRFTIKIKDNNFDIRVSTLPVQFGESVVMRLLNQSADILNLNQIGMPDEMLQRLRKVFTMPNGILLVTGPTGSGKTTTLYGILKELNNSQKKIITVEDPVEYRIPRINQVQVQPKINLTFANVLRSMLRQDPDIIMIGELRDQETVSIALRAAMTGHLVLATLHTNDAASSVVRLIDMGAEAYLVATVLRAVVAQRLVRRICQNCMVSYSLTSQDHTWLAAVGGEAYTTCQFKHGQGCTYCHNTGFKGQMGVFELLEMTPPLIDAIHQSNTIDFASFVKNDINFKKILQSGIELAEQGITTIGEIIRIIGEEIMDDVTRDKVK